MVACENVKRNGHDVCAMMLQMQWPLATVLMRFNATHTNTNTNTEKRTKQIIYLPGAGGVRIGGLVTVCHQFWMCLYRDVIFHMCDRPKQILQNNTIHDDFEFLFIYLFVYTLLLSLLLLLCAGDAYAIVFRPFSHKCDSLTVNRVVRTNANTRRLFINCKCIKRADWMGLVLNECVRTFPFRCLCICICIFAQIVERSARFMCTQKRIHTRASIELLACWIQQASADKFDALCACACISSDTQQ